MFIQNLEGGIILPKDDVVECTGQVIDALPGAKFKVQLENGHVVTASMSGKLRLNSIRVLVGDKVDVEVSVYDLDKGRITWRYPNASATRAPAAAPNQNKRKTK